MVGAKASSTVILASILLSAKSGTKGAVPSCPNAAAVDLTRYKPDMSGSVNKSGDVYPPEDVWFESGRTFGCPCNLRTCLPVCCALGYAKIGDHCAVDKLASAETDLRLNHATYEGSSHVFVDDPDCDSTFESETLVEKNYKLFQDGSIYLTDLEQKVELGGYCLFRETDSPVYLAKACFDSKLTALSIWLLVSTNICALFLLATFVVYTIIPELNNLQGWMFRCYLASYVSCVSLISPPILAAKITLEPIVYSDLNSNTTRQLSFSPGTLQNLSIVSVLGIYYFGFASMMWLNAMSFDIWRKFRRIQSSQTVNIKKRQKTMFVRYCIYAWGGSIVLPLIHYCCKFFGTTKRNDSSLRSIVQYWMYSPIIGLVICNTCFYISTALTIKQRKKDTAHLLDGVNKHQQKENEQWFKLYFKLFLIMGGPQLLWAVAVYLKSRIFWQIVCTIEALQGVSTFLIFVWKEDVKRSVQKRFEDALRGLLVSCLRRDSIIAIEN